MQPKHTSLPFRAGLRQRRFWLAALCGVVIVSVSLGLVLTPAVKPAQAQTSTAGDLSWWVVNCGGGRSTSANFALESAVGQPGVGESASDNYKLASGFMTMMDQWTIFLPLVLK